MTNQTTDPYATLGVPRTASNSQVREAYRRLAKRYHPDVRVDAEATGRMQRINQAWEILSTPARRARYDASVGPGMTAASPHWAGSPRRARPVDPSRREWAAYGGRRYAEYATRGYADLRDEPGLGPLRWAGLLLLVPVAVLLAAIVPGGPIGFPLFGILIVLIVSGLVGRDG
jgi:curved DNA-binding protein CbpA